LPFQLICASIRAMLFIRQHKLFMIVLTLALISWVTFFWAEYGYFCDQGREHGNKGCESFWSMAHIHDMVYNLAANWQSELTFGVLLVLVLNKLGDRDSEDKDAKDI
jgi:hypothetical protein